MEMELGKDLKELRDERRHTQKEIAVLLDIKSHNMVSNFESGERNPTWEQLVILLDYYDVSKKYRLNFYVCWYKNRLENHPDLESCRNEMDKLMNESMSHFEGERSIEFAQNKGLNASDSQDIENLIKFFRGLPDGGRLETVDLFVKFSKLSASKFSLLYKIMDALMKRDENYIEKIYNFTKTD